jgi:uncharacterized repeat protein (TIGR03803 family)
MKILRISGVVIGVLSLALSLAAQTFSSLHSFDLTDGSRPAAGLIQATNGSLYSTTEYGGANANGTVFKITRSGALTTLYNFCSLSNCADGLNTVAPLVQATNGSLYGTTSGGGAMSSGTVFKMMLNGTLTTLDSFAPEPDGNNPLAGMVQATDGNLYGTTEYGGLQNDGTIFKITPGGTLTTLYSFCSLSSCIDGDQSFAPLVQATDGNDDDLYGTTVNGGTADAGTVFKISLSGTLTTLYNFCSQASCTDGASSYAGLVQAANGNFYGTTIGGGANFEGTVFKITPGGTLTTLHSFDVTDGWSAQSGLVLATDGNLYGTTQQGGAHSAGTIFKITPSGTLTTLYNFCSQTGCTDGSHPYAQLVQATDGNLYGTTYYGGTSTACAAGCGTVFSLSVGLGPFVETLPTSGKVGSAVKILGTNLTGSTSVTFNGTAATFTVVSSSEITATVPVGATTGKVKVTTPHSTLTSNVNFRVTP